MPKFCEELKEKPESFFCKCKVREILGDDSKIGLMNSQYIILKVNDDLYKVNMSQFTNFSFESALQEQKRTLLNNIFLSFGLPQYLEQMDKQKFFEKIKPKDLKIE